MYRYRLLGNIFFTVIIPLASNLNILMVHVFFAKNSHLCTSYLLSRYPETHGRKSKIVSCNCR